ncbi:MAG: serine hydrolase [Pseudomonadota bacterium]
MDYLSMEPKNHLHSIAEIRSFFAQEGAGFIFSGGPRQDYIFKHYSEFMPTALIASGEKERPLTEKNGPNWLEEMTFNTDIGTMTFSDYATAEKRLNAAIVLEEDTVLFERYPNMSHTDRHIIMSVTKPITGLLTMIARQRGLVEFDAPIATYLPSLSASDWCDVPVRDLLDMCAGIEGSEEDEGGTTDLNSANMRYEAAMGTLGRGPAPSIFDVIPTLKRLRPSGEAYSYVSANSFILAWMLEELWDAPFTDIIAHEIWRPIGAEADACCAISPHGGPGGDGGVCARLRDIARFGLCFAAPSSVENNPVLPSFVDEIQNSGRESVHLAGDGGQLPAEDRPLYQNLQWDKVWSDGDFFKAGWGGQGLYISPANRLTIAYFGTPNENRERHEFQSVARTISRHRTRMREANGKK